MMRILLPVALLVAASPAATPEQAIMAVMNASAAGWNAGDLDRFMAVYAPDAVYVIKDGLLHGKATIAARYRPSFSVGGNRRGMLTFRPLGFRRIDVRHQLLWAKWILTPAHGKPESGMTTLLFTRRPEGWRIISDHSS